MELQEFHRELDATMEENRKLREGMDRLKSEEEGGAAAYRVTEREGLLKKLVEVEMDAGEALTQVCAKTWWDFVCVACLGVFFYSWDFVFVCVRGFAY